MVYTQLEMHDEQSETPRKTGDEQSKTSEHSGKFPTNDLQRYFFRTVLKARSEVGVIMGSDSDLPCMSEAAKILEQFNVPFELTVVSAHRTPQRLFDYSRTAEERGLKVIIAGAGGAAHLPGMVAAITPLPVIGVPVKSSALSGNDSLLSPQPGVRCGECVGVERACWAVFQDGSGTF